MYMKIKKLIAEFIGTFFLVCTIHICALNGTSQLMPMAAGLMLIAMVFAGGHISGAHYNPAVTIAVFLRGKCSAADVPAYIFSQLLAASIASLLVNSFLINKMGAGLDLSTNAIQAIFAEALGTFALCWVVLNVASSKDTEGNSFYGVAIGLAFAACGFSLGGISGGAFNPAIAFSLGISQISGFNNLWIYFVGEFIGAVLAAYVYLFINGTD